MRHEASPAEQNFLSILLGETAVEKEAVDLSPETADALGIPSVSPATLDQLEGHAGQPHRVVPPPTIAAPEKAELEEGFETQTEPMTPPPAVASEPAPQEVPQSPAEMVDVDGFNRVDEPPAPEEEPAAEPPLPSRLTHGRLFTDKRASPLQILDILTARYGTDWADWESDTLWWALRRDFGPVGEIARNKIMALRLAATTDMPWLDWDIFENSGLAWNDIIPLMGVYQPMTPMQMALTVHILHEIRDDELFDAEVKAYIASILEDNGFVYAPHEYFDNAQELLDRKVWMVGFRQEVIQAWEKLKDVDPMTIEWRVDHPLDVHILRLMAVKKYVEERDALRNAPVGPSASSSTTAPPVP